jgi:hypothetical protein
MYTNGYTLSIKSEKGNFLREENKDNQRRVYLPYDSEYSLYIKNKNSRRAMVEVRIDGKLIHPEGWRFILNSNSSEELKRFIIDGDLNKGKRFKFVNPEGSGEDPNDPDNGFVEVRIYEEIPNWIYNINANVTWYPTPATDDNWYVMSDSSSFSSSEPSGPIARGLLKASGPMFRSASTTINTNYCSVSNSEPGVTVGGKEVADKVNLVPGFTVSSIPIILKLRLYSVNTQEIPKQTTMAKTKESCPACFGRGFVYDFDNNNSHLCGLCGGDGKKLAILP